MVLTSSWTVVEQLAVSYLSQGFSRNDILKLLREESSHDHSDSELQQMLDNIILKQSQQGHTRSYHAQRPGEEWASDAVNGVIDDSRRQMPTGLADQLMTIQTEDENMVSLVYSLAALLFCAPMLTAFDRTSQSTMSLKSVIRLESSIELCIPQIQQVSLGWPQNMLPFPGQKSPLPLPQPTRQSLHPVRSPPANLVARP